jgi:alkaline phosphatase
MKLTSLFTGAAVGALSLLASTAALAAGGPIAPVKNIIVVINDGGGYTVYDATRLYLGKPLVTDDRRFFKTSVSTHPLRIDTVLPGSLVQDPNLVYNSAKFWDTTPVAGNSVISGYSAYPAAFAGYEWSRLAHPDSGNTASSIANGIKSYNNAINVDGAGTPQITVTDLIDAARRLGKRTGVVSTVQFADATPAALGGAHNLTRANRTQVAAELFSSGKLDVIAGTGNPDFDDNGLARAPLYNWIDAPLWSDLKNGTNLSFLNSQNWTLLQDKADIDAIAAGTAPAPAKLAMIIKGDNSHQYNRAGFNVNPTLHEVYDPARNLPNCVTNGVPVSAGVACQQPPKTNVPTLTNLTLAALNALGNAQTGFYLMAEAGGVDRAEHGNSTARMIEDQIESNNTVQAIIDWVDRPDTDANWGNTLLIVTADHDHLLYGPQGDTVPFQPLEDKGAGVTPGNKWFGPNHGTGLVPLYARGKGASQLVRLATDIDSYTDGQGRSFGYGAYLDQTKLGEVLKGAATR